MALRDLCANFALLNIIIAVSAEKETAAPFEKRRGPLDPSVAAY
jgi:hypothetical protein